MFSDVLRKVCIFIEGRKVDPALLLDEFKTSKKTRKTQNYENTAETKLFSASSCSYLVSDIPIFFFSTVFSILERAQIFFEENSDPWNIP